MASSKPACIFCKIVRREIPATVVFENDRVLAFNDIHPIAPVHVLVVPKHHVATLNDVDADNLGDMAALLDAAKHVATAMGVHDEGYRVFFNVGRGAGQEVFHVHMHLVARASLSTVVKGIAGKPAA
jgi:histidine triad (HIT) family protein